MFVNWLDNQNFTFSNRSPMLILSRVKLTNIDWTRDLIFFYSRHRTDIWLGTAHDGPNRISISGRQHRLHGALLPNLFGGIPSCVHLVSAINVAKNLRYWYLEFYNFSYEFKWTFPQVIRCTVIWDFVYALWHIRFRFSPTYIGCVTFPNVCSVSMGDCVKLPVAKRITSRRIAAFNETSFWSHLSSSSYWLSWIF